MALTTINNSIQKKYIHHSVPEYYTILMNFEKFMENPEDINNVFSYDQAVKRDEIESFPVEACEKLEQWGLHRFYVSEELGGTLKSFEVTFWISDT